MSDCSRCARVREVLARSRLLVERMGEELEEARRSGNPVDPHEYLAVIVRETLDAVGEAVS